MSCTDFFPNSILSNPSLKTGTNKFPDLSPRWNKNCLKRSASLIRKNLKLGSQKKKYSVDVAFKEEICWRQKARIQWLKEGDNNTRFYHDFANDTKARNLISSLSIGGSLTEGPNLIETALINFYKSLFTENSKREAWFGSWNGKIISPQKASWLEKDFTLEEIKKATFELSKLSSPPGWIFLTLLSRMLGCYQR